MGSSTPSTTSSTSTETGAASFEPARSRQLPTSPSAAARPTPWRATCSLLSTSARASAAASPSPPCSASQLSPPYIRSRGCPSSRRPRRRGSATCTLTCPASATSMRSGTRSCATSSTCFILYSARNSPTSRGGRESPGLLGPVRLHNLTPAPCRESPTSYLGI
ncbi:hypothetical protein B0T26DRAFT_872720 [Lasiosphaeria miniovina]|uniref:Uncharacterized protein n=1 Tax=Lasiosphaeria miniovina TaxID=1954250 RepID=A0AA40AMI9_9PEZI|nr:uncharacterized protein B0T26DRAFT_872720 [Lasiosphaeria miniovina]KAK0718554.1 hypothetical protein B0T26DRAFT_872720 [Lasiosphaeria miniovina]